MKHTQQHSKGKQARNRMKAWTAGLALASLALAGCGDGSDADDVAAIEAGPDAQVLAEGEFEGSLVKIIDSAAGVQYAEIVRDGHESPLESVGKGSIAAMYKALASADRRDPAILRKLESGDATAKGADDARREAPAPLTAVDAAQGRDGATSFFNNFCQRVAGSTATRRCTDADRRGASTVNSTVRTAVGFLGIRDRFVSASAGPAAGSGTATFELVVAIKECQVAGPGGLGITGATGEDPPRLSVQSGCDQTTLLPTRLSVPAGRMGRITINRMEVASNADMNYFFRVTPARGGAAHVGGQRR